MKDARIDPAWRDYCAHLLIPLNKCRHDTFYLPWKCSHERHEYERCQYGEYVCLVCERLAWLVLCLTNGAVPAPLFPAGTFGLSQPRRLEVTRRVELWCLLFRTCAQLGKKKYRYRNAGTG